jgi:hypothetical protein
MPQDSKSAVSDPKAAPADVANASARKNGVKKMTVSSPSLKVTVKLREAKPTFALGTLPLQRASPLPPEYASLW